MFKLPRIISLFNSFTPRLLGKTIQDLSSFSVVCPDPTFGMAVADVVFMWLTLSFAGTKLAGPCHTKLVLPRTHQHQGMHGNQI